MAIEFLEKKLDFNSRLSLTQLSTNDEVVLVINLYLAGHAVSQLEENIYDQQRQKERNLKESPKVKPTY